MHWGGGVLSRSQHDHSLSLSPDDDAHQRAYETPEVRGSGSHGLFLRGFGIILVVFITRLSGGCLFFDCLRDGMWHLIIFFRTTRKSKKCAPTEL